MTAIDRYRALCVKVAELNSDLAVIDVLNHAADLLALTGRVRGEATPKPKPARPRKAAGAGERHGEAA